MDELGRRNIAMVGFTYIYDTKNNKETEPLAFSSLNNVTGDGTKVSDYFTPEGNISVQMVRMKQQLTWEEIKDNFGRPVTVYDWVSVKGIFGRVKATNYYYSYQDNPDRIGNLGLKSSALNDMEKLGKLGFALVGETCLIDPKTGKSESWLNPKTGKAEDKPVSSSVMQEIRPGASGIFSRYFNQNGEMLIRLKKSRNQTGMGRTERCPWPGYLFL
jgi:hypothetical protein